MKMSFNCPKCSNVLQADSNWSGQNTLCPHCKNMINIPAFSEPPQGATRGMQTNGYVHSAAGSSEFFLIRIFDNLFSSLRSTPFASAVSRHRNTLTKAGTICYMILGVLIFLISCKRASEAASAWQEISGGLACLAGVIIFSACGMYMFKLYNGILKGEKNFTVPLPFLNSIAAIFCAAGVYFLIYGITAVCLLNDALNILFSNLGYSIVCFGIFTAAVAPAEVSVSTGDQSSVDSAVGTAFFMARAALFTIPFLWSWDAAYRIINLLIHLGADNAKFAIAYRISIDGIPHNLLFPLAAWCGYITFDFIISAVKSLIDSRR